MAGKYLFAFYLIIASTGICLAQSAYIANNNDKTITVINVATDTVTAVIPVSYAPFGVSASYDGSKVYIAGKDTISVLNTSTNTITDIAINTNISNSLNLYCIVVTPDGSKVYVGSTGDSIVIVVNTATNTNSDSVIVRRAPYGIAVSPDGNKVYTANIYTGTISVINTATNTVSNTIQTNPGPWGICVSPDNSKVYVANEYANNVTVISTVSNTVIRTIPVGSKPISITISPDGSKIYVANHFGNSVSVIDTFSNTVTATIPVGPKPYGISISPDGGKVYAVNYNNAMAGSISVINTSLNSVTATIPVGIGPISVGNFISPYVQTPTTGISSKNKKSESISIFPNPSSGHFLISLPNDNAAVRIVNAIGQTIIQTTTLDRETNFQLVENGVYFIYITTNQGIAVRKLIVSLH